MNDREIRSKKTSTVNIRNPNDKRPHCQPKQPPNISRHFQETKKKQSQSREMFRLQPQIFCIEVEKPKSKIMLQGRPSRPSQSKNQEDQKIKKTKRQTHHINMPHKSKGNKMNFKQNRESRSNMDMEDNRRQKQKMFKTQVIEQRQNPSLTCKQKFIKKIKKAKGGSEDIQGFQHCRISSQQIIPKKTFAEEIADFESKNTYIQIQAESETLTQLFAKEEAYFRIQNYNCYLMRKQPEMTWWKRAKVMNWMIELLSEMGSLREVFALAANYIDRYLAVGEQVRQQKLQVLACAALLVANKVQGITFLVKQFQIPTCPFGQILDLEQKICQTLKWKLNPPTLNMWANRIAQHWDLYLDHHEHELPGLILSNMYQIKFKDSESYVNFRTLMQYIDLVVLDIETLQYHNRELAASFIYIMLSQKLNLYSKDEICHKWPTSSQYVLQQNQLNDFYCEFLTESFGFSLKDLLPTIQYCSTFMKLPLTFELPTKIDEDDDDSIPFSSLCSMITCNPHNLSYLQSRMRDYR